MPGGEDGHPGRGEQDRDPLRARQPLAEDEHAEQHVHERVDEVADLESDHVQVRG